MTSLPTLESVLYVDLTRGADHATLVGAGWPGMDGGVGCRLGRHESLILPLPAHEGAYFLQLRLAAPLREDGGMPVPLRVRVNGSEVATHRVRQLATLTAYLPPEVIEAEAGLQLVLERDPASTSAPDAPEWVGLHTIRVLRVIDRPSAGVPAHDAPEAPPPRELLLDFESLGEGPAFALLRRRLGVRPLDVMQAGHAPLADWLALLDSDFAVFATPGAIQAAETAQTAAEATWSVRCAGLGFHYETGVPVAMRRAAAVEAHETARLAIATRRLRHTLASGDKILLLQQDEPATDEHIIPLLAAVQDRGPNTLLWVTPVEPGHPAGSVEVLMNGLLRGYVAPGLGEDADASWLAMCRRAWRAWRAMSGQPASAQAA